MTREDEVGDRFPWWLGAVGGVFLLVAAGLIAASLRNPTPPTFRPVPAGDTAVVVSGGTRRVTLDARDGDRWIYFDASSHRVRDATAGGWDLAARRFHLIVNGGPALPGDAAAAVAGSARPADVVPDPRRGWTATRRDEDGQLHHPLLEEWYDYDFFSHLLTPRARAYLLRTTEGRTLKLRFLSYYCPGPEGGCVTFRYAPVEAGPPGPPRGGPPGGGESGP